MATWLTDYRDQFQEQILTFLWHQWSLMGVAGIEHSEDNRVIDPEALLLFSLSVCRYDPRLFDEILDWLVQYGHFINVQRLRQIQRKFPFQCAPQLSAVAEMLSRKARYKLKWSGLIGKSIAEPSEPLFMDIEGQPLPYPQGDMCYPPFRAHGLLRGELKLRGRSQSFNVQTPATLLLQVRSLVGMHARAEILCLLACVPEIHPAEAARQTMYYQKTIQSALVEMAQSGAVTIRSSGKTKFYRLKPDCLDAFLKPNHQSPQWLHWPSVLLATEKIQSGLMKLSHLELDPLLLASELRQLLQSAGKGCLDSGLNQMDFSQAVTPEDILAHFQSCVRSLGDYLNATP